MNFELHLRSPTRFLASAALLCLTFPAALPQSRSEPIPSSSLAVSDTNHQSPEGRQEPQAQEASGPSKLTRVDAWEILSTATNNRNSLRRAEAVVALGTAGSQRRVVRLVERGLDDKDASIRELAARTLGEMRARSSIPKLIEALKDDSPDVSFAAAKSLWAMGNRSGREVLLQILSGERDSPGVMNGGLIKNQFQATRKKLDNPKELAVMGAKEAATSLFGPAAWGIKIMEELTVDRSASARATSAILLGPDATLDTLRQLQDALNDKNWIVRAAAAQALGASRHREQIPFLQPLLGDSKPAVRCMAAAAMVRLSAGPRGATASQGTPATAEVHPAFDPGPRKSFK